jgi:tetratricopeptide (TPR) repeat protein
MFRLRTILFLFCLAICFECSTVFSQDISIPAISPSQQALELFNNGKYSEALAKYQKLLNRFPKDPLYNYFAGVCMVELKIDLSQAISYLDQSIFGKGPTSAYFYKGQAFRLLNNPTEANNCIALFKQNASRKELKQFIVDDNIGKVEVKEVKPNIKAETPINILKINESDTLKNITTPKSIAIVKRDSIKESIILKNVKLIDSQFNSNDTGVYVVTVTKALVLQVKVDSLLDIILKMKKQVLIVKDENEKNQLKSKIAQLELQAADLQNLSDLEFARARNFELKPIMLVVKKNDTVINQNSNKKQMQFGISSSTIYSKENPFPHNVSIPDGVVYTIQLGVFSKKIGFDYFKGLNPICGDSLLNVNAVKYYVGRFYKFSDADDSLRKVKSYGFKDAFLIAYYNGQKFPVERARSIEDRY